MDHYNTIAREATAEFKDRGSRFIAYASPVENIPAFKSFLQELKKEHPKAAHHCFAYRIEPDGRLFRVSDDGEPSGTAGKPILGQLIAKNLTNTAVIVVRYFGGTLLGVPGLINAYKTASALVLQLTPVVQKQIEIPLSLEFDYTRLNDVMQLVKQYQCTVIQQENQLFCFVKISVPKNRLEEFHFRLADMHDVQIQQVGAN